MRCRVSSVHGIPSIGPTADATVTLNPQPKAEINNLGRLFLTVHNCARSIPKIGGERVFKLGSRYSYRRQHSDPDRPHHRRDAFLRLRLRLDLCRVFELYGYAVSDLYAPCASRARRSLPSESRYRGPNSPAAPLRRGTFTLTAKLPRAERRLQDGF